MGDGISDSTVSIASNGSGSVTVGADFLGLGMPMPLLRGIALRYKATNRKSQRGQASYMIGWNLRRVRRSTGCRRCQARAPDPQGMVGTEQGGKSNGHGLCKTH